MLAEAATDLAIELGAQRIEAYPEPNSHPNQPFATWNTFSGHQDNAHAEFFQLMEKK